MTRQADQRQPASKRPVARRLAAGAAAIVAALAIPSLTAAGGAAASAGRPGQPAAAASGGTLIAWGDDEYGQLGDGLLGSTSATPVKVKLPAGTAITSVRAGCGHTVALTSKGTVLAWGDNNSGQLGNGTIAISGIPVKVKLPAGTTVKAIRAGCDHSLALTTKGQLLAWGDNFRGELGNGTITGSTTPVRVKLPKGTTVTAISTGGLHTLALTSKGTVLAWGFNSSGQLGDGTTTDRDTPVRVKLPKGITVSGLAAGEYDSMALTSKGAVLAWGDNGSGQLGNGTITSSTTPVRVKMPNGAIVRGLFGGCSHTLAFTTAGKVLAWGLNDTGQLGDGTTTDRHTPVLAKMPKGKGAVVTAISAGCSYSVARTANGHVLAWGENVYGELGNGSTANRHTPGWVKLPAGLAAIAIGAGSEARFGLAIVHKA